MFCKPCPMLLQGRKQHCIVIPLRIRPNDHHHIDAAESLLMMAKAFANHPFNPVADHGGFGCLAGNGQTEAGKPQRIGPGKHCEIKIYGLYRPRKNILKVSFADQPGAPLKARRVHNGLRGQTSTALGTTGLDHSPTALGSHPGAKPMGALTMDDARLKSPLHNIPHWLD